MATIAKHRTKTCTSAFGPIADIGDSADAEKCTIEGSRPQHYPDQLQQNCRTWHILGETPQPKVAAIPSAFVAPIAHWISTKAMKKRNVRAPCGQSLINAVE
jgi:hypothetical protein